jgi:hypothetical protein
MPTVNPQDEINEVRANTGGIGVLNLGDAEIDTALSAADQETTERTGLDSNSTYKPYLRRKIKILVATAYLLIRFKNSKDVLRIINDEIRQTQTLLSQPDLSDTDDETIIDSNDSIDGYVTLATQLNYWSGPRKRSVGTGRYSGGNVTTDELNNYYARHGVL